MRVCEPVIFERPVLGWVAGGVTPEGVLDAEDGGDWEGDTCRARCSGLVRPVAAIGSRWRCVVEAEHRPPSPFCGCGLAVYPDAPEGRWRDRYRDRLGYRMQTAALAVTWGGVIVTRDCVRGQYGTVLALLAHSDDVPRRRERIELAARRLGAEIIDIDDLHGRPAFGAIADRVGAPHGQRLEREHAAALLRRRDVRRWHTLSRHHDEGIQSTMSGLAFGALLSGAGLTALGIPAVASAAIVVPPALALAVKAVRHTLRGLVQVEALAADGAGRQIARPIALSPPRRMLGQIPGDVLDEIAR